MGDRKGEIAAVKMWLTRHLLQNVTDKVVEDVRDAILRKAAVKMGLKYAIDLTPANLASKLPGVSLAKATIFGAKVMLFEGDYVANGHRNFNRFDPIKQEDQYVEYLVYSWARGKPGYITEDFEALGRTLRKH